MEFILDKNTLHIDSEKRRISLSSDSIVLDGMTLEMPGEYEKWGFLSYITSQDGELIGQFRIEWYTCAFLPFIKKELSPEVLDFLGDVDILILPGNKESIPMIEVIEPRMIIAYGEWAHEIGTSMGATNEPTIKYKLKEADLSAEKTGVVVLSS